MTNCTHDLAEMETASAADALCQLCLLAEVERLRAENTTMRATLDGIRSAVNDWRAADYKRVR